jgi:hypothetical protein
MKDEINIEDDGAKLARARRIVVSDNLQPDRGEILGRRLENPPPDHVITREVKHQQNPKRNGKNVTLVKRGYIVGAALVVGVITFAGIGVLAVKRLNRGKVVVPTAEERKSGPEFVSGPVSEPPKAANETNVDDLRRIEEQAKQVMRRISRDSRPYSFSESSLREIQTRTMELSRSSQLSGSLRDLQIKGDQVGASAAKEGLQPSLVMLLGLALTNGGESGDCVNAAAKAVPMLATLNKTFGSNDGDSSLILIAAFQEGPGTKRSHPLLRRINRVVTNPMTERNVWYLNEQKTLSPAAYALVIDTIAFGVITRNPREFGFENEPLNF